MSRPRAQAGAQRAGAPGRSAAGTVGQPPRRAPYDDVAVAVPVTVPYVRYSIRAAHWFIARALAELLQRAQLQKSQVDG
ncbi:MAG TPA: hypothetical protein VM491_15635, partial [Burkholderiaceae bacterium]|nr:hypothetical protein [Burkholderiaceae bacterium]